MVKEKSSRDKFIDDDLPYILAIGFTIFIVILIAIALVSVLTPKTLEQSCAWAENVHQTCVDYRIDQCLKNERYTLDQCVELVGR